jgi:hypothetical protein
VVAMESLLGEEQVLSCQTSVVITQFLTILILMLIIILFIEKDKKK